VENISDNSANDPLPENGFISTNLVNSFGIPKKLNRGDKSVVKRLASPLISNNSVRIKILTKNGKILSANGIAVLAP